MNPADLVSRGLYVQELLNCSLWWQGPDWLVLSPEDWPRRPDINLSRELPELKATVLLIRQPVPTFDLWNRFSSFHKLVAVVAWIRRFMVNTHKVDTIKEDRLTSSELTCHVKHPIILSNHHSLTKCLVLQVHLDSGHAGIGAMLAILADHWSQ